MIGLDTNVVIRYLMQDEPQQAARASAFIEQHLSRENPGYISLLLGHGSTRNDTECKTRYLPTFRVIPCASVAMGTVGYAALHLSCPTDAPRHLSPHWTRPGVTRDVTPGRRCATRVPGGI